MYVLFADGSGSGRAADPSRSAGFYMLSGVVVHESNLRRLESAISCLKLGLFPDAKPCELEFHAPEIWNSHGSFRLDKYNLMLEDKRHIFDQVVDLVCSFDVGLISVVVDKSSDTAAKGRYRPSTKARNN